MCVAREPTHELLPLRRTDSVWCCFLPPEKEEDNLTDYTSEELSDLGELSDYDVNSHSARSNRSNRSSRSFNEGSGREPESSLQQAQRSQVCASLFRCELSLSPLTLGCLTHHTAPAQTSMCPIIAP
jgi:hypothetical protein